MLLKVEKGKNIKRKEGWRTMPPREQMDKDVMCAEQMDVKTVSQRTCCQAEVAS